MDIPKQMRKKLLLASYLISIILSSCISPTPSLSAIREISVTQKSRDDVIRLNNCAGTGKTSQNVELSRSIRFLSGTITTLQKVDAERLLDSKYSEDLYKGQKIQLVANPGEYTEYTVSLFYEIHTGVINDEIQYEVEIPLDIELVQARNIGCAIIETPVPVTPLPSPPAEVAKVSYLPKENGMTLESQQWDFSSYYIGTVEWSYPDEMAVDESTSLRLAIIPNNELVNLYKLSSTDNELPKYFYINENFQLGTSAIATLTAVKFSVETDANSKKSLDGFTPAEWFWNISPKGEGRQSLIIHVAIPVVVNNVTERLIETNIPIEFNVVKSPAVTPTVLSPSERVGEELIQNSSNILVAIISLFGVILTAVLTYWAATRKSKDAPVQSNITDENQKVKKNIRSQKKKR